MNYVNTFIQVAPDTKATIATVPRANAAKKSTAVVEYELLSKKPYTYTQQEVQFAVHMHRQGISPRSAKADLRKLRQEFFSKSRACMRTSPLAKTYGWGLHFNAEGKVALVPIESSEYDTLATDPTIKQTRAMRSKRSEARLRDRNVRSRG